MGSVARVLYRVVALPVMVAATVAALGMYAGSSSKAATSPVLVGAGDIATCRGEGDEATARLLENVPGTVFTAGDNAYTNGTAEAFQNCYGPTWGRHKGRTMPSPGKHDYDTAGAAGTRCWWGRAR